MEWSGKADGSPLGSKRADGISPLTMQPQREEAVPMACFQPVEGTFLSRHGESSILCVTERSQESSTVALPPKDSQSSPAIKDDSSYHWSGFGKEALPAHSASPTDDCKQKDERNVMSQNCSVSKGLFDTAQGNCSNTQFDSFSKNSFPKSDVSKCSNVESKAAGSTLSDEVIGEVPCLIGNNVGDVKGQNPITPFKYKDETTEKEEELPDTSKGLLKNSSLAMGAETHESRVPISPRVTFNIKAINDLFAPEDEQTSPSQNHSDAPMLQAQDLKVAKDSDVPHEHKLGDGACEQPDKDTLSFVDHNAIVSKDTTRGLKSHEGSGRKLGVIRSHTVPNIYEDRAPDDQDKNTDLSQQESSGKLQIADGQKLERQYSMQCFGNKSAAFGDMTDTDSENKGIQNLDQQVEREKLRNDNLNIGTTLTSLKNESETEKDIFQCPVNVDMVHKDVSLRAQDTAVCQNASGKSFTSDILSSSTNTTSHKREEMPMKENNEIKNQNTLSSIMLSDSSNKESNNLECQQNLLKNTEQHIEKHITTTPDTSQTQLEEISSTKNALENASFLPPNSIKNNVGEIKEKNNKDENIEYNANQEDVKQIQHHQRNESATEAFATNATDKKNSDIDIGLNISRGKESNMNKAEKQSICDDDKSHKTAQGQDRLSPYEYKADETKADSSSEEELQDHASTPAEAVDSGKLFTVNVSGNNSAQTSSHDLPHLLAPETEVLQEVQEEEESDEEPYSPNIKMSPVQIVPALKTQQTCDHSPAVEYMELNMSTVEDNANEADVLKSVFISESSSAKVDLKLNDTMPKVVKAQETDQSSSGAFATTNIEGDIFKSPLMRSDLPVLSAKESKYHPAGVLFENILPAKAPSGAAERRQGSMKYSLSVDVSMMQHSDEADRLFLHKKDLGVVSEESKGTIVEADHSRGGTQEELQFNTFQVNTSEKTQIKPCIERQNANESKKAVGAEQEGIAAKTLETTQNEDQTKISESHDSVQVDEEAFMESGEFKKEKQVEAGPMKAAFTQSSETHGLTEIKGTAGLQMNQDESLVEKTEDEESQVHDAQKVDVKQKVYSLALTEPKPSILEGEEKQEVPESELLGKESQKLIEGLKVKEESDQIDENYQSYENKEMQHLETTPIVNEQETAVTDKVDKKIVDDKSVMATAEKTSPKKELDMKQEKKRKVDKKRDISKKTEPVSRSPTRSRKSAEHATRPGSPRKRQRVPKSERLLPSPAPSNKVGSPGRKSKSAEHSHRQSMAKNPCVNTVTPSSQTAPIRRPSSGKSMKSSQVKHPVTSTPLCSGSVKSSTPKPTASTGKLARPSSFGTDLNKKDVSRSAEKKNECTTPGSASTTSMIPGPPSSHTVTPGTPGSMESKSLSSRTKVKIFNKKMDFSHVQAKCGSLANIKHVPGGGNVQILVKKIDIRHVTPKCGSKDNINHKPGRGKLHMQSPKADFKSKAHPMATSMENAEHASKNEADTLSTTSKVSSVGSPSQSDFPVQQAQIMASEVAVTQAK
uniref:Microtubule-associated protein n=1 Tax=Eptatretus burgeri TaxID=7764 RepID=A0A8C4N572_EPTBU